MPHKCLMRAKVKDSYTAALLFHLGLQMDLTLFSRIFSQSTASKLVSSLVGNCGKTLEDYPFSGDLAHVLTAIGTGFVTHVSTLCKI